MKKRSLALLVAGLLLAGCNAPDDPAEGYPAFPNTPPRARPKPQMLTPRSVYDNPLYHYPLPPHPDAPIHSPEVPAKVLEEVQPEYTEIARRARIQGIVIIQVVVDREGKNSAMRVLKPLPMGLDQKALEAVRKWRFAPATQNGKAVPSFRNVTVRFRLPPASQ